MLEPGEVSTLFGLSADDVTAWLERIPKPTPKGTRSRSNRSLTPAAVHSLMKHVGKQFSRRTAVLGMEKGGVGKSFLSVNTAVALGLAGCRVLVIDLDPEACATNFFLPQETDYGKLGTMLEVYTSESLSFKDVVVNTRYENVSLVACKGKARRISRVIGGSNPRKLLRSKMQGLDTFDLILFEVPPTFGDIISSAYLSSDLIIMPTLPDVWSLESLTLTMEDIKEECERFDAPVPLIRVLLNRFAPNRNASAEVLLELNQSFTSELLPFHIRESAPIQNAINEGASIFETRCPYNIRESILALAKVVCPVVPVESPVEKTEHSAEDIPNAQTQAS